VAVSVGLKRLFRRVDAVFMEFLVLVAVGAIVVAWIAIIAEIAGTPEADFRSGTKTTWLLISIFFGILGAAVYLMAGRPDAMARGPKVIGGHDVQRDQSGMYKCHENGCEFFSTTLAAARDHKVETGGVRHTSASSHVGVAPANAFGFGAQAAPAPALPVSGGGSGDRMVAEPESVAPPLPPALKTCPDCAEEVRFAARKCRFCGFEFAPAQA
jgi:hypothetical protein